MCVFPTSPHLLHPSKWFPLCCSAHISKPSKWFPQCHISKLLFTNLFMYVPVLCPVSVLPSDLSAVSFVLWSHLKASVPNLFIYVSVLPSDLSVASFVHYSNTSKPLFPTLFICVSVLLLPCEPPDNNLSSGSQSSERETGQNNTTKSQGDYLER